jgi:hypothetical protein
MYGEAFCIVYMPVEDVEVVLVKHGQQIKDGFDRKKFPARIQHEASMRIEIGLHLVWILDGTRLYTWRDQRAEL